MTDHENEPKNPQPEPRDAVERFRESLHSALQVLENPLYIEYAHGRGPISIDDVPADIQVGTNFLEVVEKYDWPSAEDAGIEPTLDYNDKDFIANLFLQPSGVIRGPNDTDKSYQDKSHRALNNFMAVIRSVPINNPREAKGLEGLYGLMPVVHRANVLAPDLFDAVREALSAFEMGDQDFARARLSMPESQDIVMCLNIAYRIMGRLLKVNDRAEPITSAHDALTR